MAIFFYCSSKDLVPTKANTNTCRCFVLAKCTAERDRRVFRHHALIANCNGVLTALSPYTNPEAVALGHAAAAGSHVLHGRTHRTDSVNPLVLLFKA